MFELWQKRLQKFKRIKRGYYALVLITVLYLLSFGLELIANHKAILARYQGRYYFPTFRYFRVRR